MLGKQRSPGIVILLCVVTLGIYWFVWTRKAFGEVAESKGRPLPFVFWTIALVAWIASAVIAASRIPEELAKIGEKPETAPSIPTMIQDSLADQFSPIGLAVIAVGAVMYLAQMLYLRPANELVRETANETRGAAPSSALVVLFSVLIIVGSAVPLIGAIFSLAGFVIAIVWIVQVQQAINRYWQFRQYNPPTPPMAPPQMGMPAPILMPPR
jgi:hypothetical protein